MALQTVGADDVQFTVGLRKPNLRELNQSQLPVKVVEKNIINIVARVHKHLPRNTLLEQEGIFFSRIKKVNNITSRLKSEMITICHFLLSSSQSNRSLL